jgi:hypothetical protein
LGTPLAPPRTPEPQVPSNHHSYKLLSYGQPSVIVRLVYHCILACRHHDSSKTTPFRPYSSTLLHSLPLMDHSAIQELVCASCWQDFFSTDELWKTCQSEPATVPRVWATHRAVNIARLTRSARCNWCAFLKITFEDSKDEIIDVELEQGTDTFSPRNSTGQNPRRTERRRGRGRRLTDSCRGHSCWATQTVSLICVPS